MKKLSALILTSALILVLSACNNSEVKNSQNDTAKPNNQSQAQTVDNTKPNTNTDTNSTVRPAESTIQAEFISRDRAIEIALSHAGANANDVYDLDAELDRERGEHYWEVDFEYDRYEYSYEIDALTSEIVISNKERD